MQVRKQQLELDMDVVWKGFPAFPAHLRMRPVSRGNSRRATWVGPHAERPRVPGPLLRRKRGPDSLLFSIKQLGAAPVPRSLANPQPAYPALPVPFRGNHIKGSCPPVPTLPLLLDQPQCFPVCPSSRGLACPLLLGFVSITNYLVYACHHLLLCWHHQT